MAARGDANADNVDDTALKGYVDRLFNVEQTFADVKAEYTDDKNDLKAEIKSRTDETGVTFAQVQSLVKVRMNEATALEDQAETNATMELYELLYGFSAETSVATDDDEEDDPLS